MRADPTGSPNKVQRALRGRPRKRGGGPRPTHRFGIPTPPLSQARTTKPWGPSSVSSLVPGPCWFWMGILLLPVPDRRFVLLVLVRWWLLIGVSFVRVVQPCCAFLFGLCLCGAGSGSAVSPCVRPGITSSLVSFPQVFPARECIMPCQV